MKNLRKFALSHAGDAYWHNLEFQQFSLYISARNSRWLQSHQAAGRFSFQLFLGRKWMHS